jgi:hypothetical protein
VLPRAAAYVRCVPPPALRAARRRRARVGEPSWSPPCAPLLSQLDRLRQVPYLKTLLDLPVVHSLLLGLLPGLALRLFVLLLPLVLYPLNRMAGAVSKADVDFQVSTHYFIFQVTERRRAAPAAPRVRERGAPRRSLIGPGPGLAVRPPPPFRATARLPPQAPNPRQPPLAGDCGAPAGLPPLVTRPHPSPQVLAVFGASFISGAARGFRPAGARGAPGPAAAREASAHRSAPVPWRPSHPSQPALAKPAATRADHAPER